MDKLNQRLTKTSVSKYFDRFDQNFEILIIGPSIYCSIIQSNVRKVFPLNLLKTEKFLPLKSKIKFVERKGPFIK